MKPLHIHFVTRRPRFLAAGVVAVLLLALSAGAWLEWRARAARADVQKQMAELNANIRGALEVRKPEGSPQAEPPWVQEADATLRHDWNRLMGGLEGIVLPGVRLLSIQAGTYPDQVRVEYQLDGWTRVAELSYALNHMKASSGHWSLISVGASNSQTPSGPGIRAVWER